MAKKSFTLKAYGVPGKARSKSLQNANATASVTTTTSAIGVPTKTVYQTIQEVTNNYYSEGGFYKGRINVTDLLALREDIDIAENDMYLVYSSGNAETGWPSGGTFTIDDEEYSDETFFQWMLGKWSPIDASMVDTSNSIKFDELKGEIWMIEETNNKTSYWNLPNEGLVGGIAIARLGSYKLNEDGVYIPNVQTKGTKGGAYYGENYTKTLYIPYCRSYQQNGETIYTAGCLSATDYEKLKTMESGGTPTWDIEDVAVDTNDSILMYDPNDGQYFNSVNRLYSYYKTKSNMPNFYSTHASSDIPSAQRFNPGVCVATDGFWYYDGNKYVNLNKKKYGIVIEWEYNSETDTNYFSTAEYSNTQLWDSEDGIMTFYIRIDGLSTAREYRYFMATHSVAVTMTGINTSTNNFQQMVWSLNSTITQVVKDGFECIKIKLPNQSYYRPTSEQFTYFGIAFNSICD